MQTLETVIEKNPNTENAPPVSLSPNISQIPILSQMPTIIKSPTVNSSTVIKKYPITSQFPITSLSPSLSQTPSLSQSPSLSLPPQQTEQLHIAQGDLEHQVYEREYNDMVAQQRACEESLQEYRQALKMFNQMQEDVLSKCDKLQKQIKVVSKLTKIHEKSNEIKKQRLEETKLYFNVSKQWKQLFPSPGTQMIQLLIGKSNIRMLNPKERQNYKTEYNDFRRLYSLLFVVVNLLLAFVINFHFIDYIWFIFNTYFYLAVGLRERILKVNGSHIKSWWLFHHLLCFIAALVAAMWENSVEYQQTRLILFTMGAYLGVVNNLQAHYQQSRLYTLVSLGKVSEMDVPNRDSVPLHWTMKMTILLPFLIIGYIFQAYYGIICTIIYFKNRVWTQWNLIFIGGTFLFLALGNAVTTLTTFIVSHGGKRVPYSLEWTSHFLYGGSGEKNMKRSMIRSPQTSPGLHPIPYQQSLSSIQPFSLSHHSQNLYPQEQQTGTHFFKYNQVKEKEKEKEKLSKIDIQLKKKQEKETKIKEKQNQKMEKKKKKQEYLEQKKKIKQQKKDLKKNQKIDEKKVDDVKVDEKEKEVIDQQKEDQLIIEIKEDGQQTEIEKTDEKENEDGKIEEQKVDSQVISEDQSNLKID